MLKAARRFATIILLTLGLAAIGQSPAIAQEKLKIVTSFTILADLTSAIGGDRVEVTTIIGPGGDAHAFEPSPADARAIAEADLVIINGLEFESWIDRLISSVGYAGPVVVASEGIDPLPGEGHEHEEAGDDHDHEHEEAADEHDHEAEGDGHDHGEFDPHGWQDVANTRLYVANIAAALTSIDRDGEAFYADNLAAYDAELALLDDEIRAAIDALPEENRTIVTSHDAFGYFAAAYGLEFLAPLGINPEAAPGARATATLIQQIEDEGIDAVFIEALTDPRLIEQIAEETGASIGGALYSDTLSEEDGPAPTYLEMMRHNVRTLAAALAD